LDWLSCYNLFLIRPNSALHNIATLNRQTNDLGKHISFESGMSRMVGLKLYNSFP